MVTDGKAEKDALAALQDLESKKTRATADHNEYGWRRCPFTGELVKYSPQNMRPNPNDDQDDPFAWDDD